MECRIYEKISGGRPNQSVRCWTCNQVGHVVVACHTCSGFGHKSQECASKRSQPRRSASYTSVRRFEDQKTKTYRQGHSQSWRHEVDQRSDGNSNKSVRCWTCNNVGHIAAYFHTMRCYSCSGIRHKAQYCWST